MTVYFSLLAAAVILGIPLCRKKAGKIIYCSVMGTALFAAAALRSSTGFDYNSYGWLYIGYMSQTTEEIGVTRIEKGYAMINKLLADFIPDHQIIFVIFAAFFAVCATLVIYKHCHTPWIGFTCFLTVGVYFVTLDYIRQMTAAFIVFYALGYIEKNQFFRYAAIVLFASCFHISALLMIPFYFILRIKMTPITLGVYSAVTTVCMIFSREIIGFVTRYCYKYYTLTNPHVAYGCNPATMIFYAVLFTAAFLVRKRLSEEERMNDVFLNCMCFALIFEIFGVKHSVLSRFSVLFIIPAAVILIPRVFEILVEKCGELAKDNKKKKTALTVSAAAGIAVLNIVMYSVFMLINYNGVMPYRTVFDDIVTEEAEQQ